MRALFGLGLGMVAGAVIFGLVMEPSAGDWMTMGLTFALMAMATLAAAWALPRLAQANRSIRTTVLSLAMVSVLIVVGGLVATGQLMFVSTHDLALLLIVVGFGCVAAGAFAFSVSGPLTSELTELSGAASAVASGDLSIRPDSDRADEVGELSRSIGEMAGALETAEQMRMKDDAGRRELFASIGHDLRTPLSALQAAIEAVQDGVADDPNRYLESMGSDVSALSSLVDRLFLLARLEAGDVSHELEAVDLTEVADEALEVVRPLCTERNLIVTMDMDHRVVAVASTEGIARVVRNLLDNAVRHSPPGGEIVVRVSNGDGARMEITDEGQGFSSDFLDHAFDRSTRDDGDRSRSNGGAGLGLAISRRYVEDFGGHIWAEAGPGGKVAFTLPHTVG